MTKIQNSAENWENGALGLSADHAVRVPDEVVAAVERATGNNMQLISMRMPQELVVLLKEIAKYHGVGYQPLIRDLLQRWAANEIKMILEERLKIATKMADKAEEMEPLTAKARKLA